MSDTFYEESVFKKHWTWWPTMFCSMMHSMLTWHDMSYTKINKEGLITYVFKFRRGKRIHTALQMSRSKKLKIIIAERFISHHELAVLNSQHTSIQSTWHSDQNPCTPPPHTHTHNHSIIQAKRMTKSHFESTRDWLHRLHYRNLH